MAIPESQLDTWTHTGASTQSSATYQSIKGIIEHKDAPYASRRIDSFLQGSYGNDTNIYGADTDVDIVLRTRALFHYNINDLPEPQKAEFKRAYPMPSEYKLGDFKKEVQSWLFNNYAGDLDTSGKKALRIKANGNRRSSDILLVAPYKHYSRYVSEQDNAVREGVLFVTSGGTEIVNYPKQHSDNMTAKHQAANKQLKPTARIFKNMRNKMLEKGIIKAGSAPSYFIEGILSNVPAEYFTANRQQTIEACWGWINTCDHGSLMCANGIHALSRDNTPTSWSVLGYSEFVGGVRTLWTQW
jgi:hypothetical protein